MSGRAEGDPTHQRGDPSLPATGSYAPLGHRLQPPTARTGVITRSALIARLLASDSPVITLVAPPGYGKTTVLAQWAEQLGPRVAWVSCEKTDDDPVVLWTAVATAINEVSVPSPAVSQLVATKGGSIGIVPAFVDAIESIGAPTTIVLDHVENVASRESHAALAEFSIRVPRGWQLALASRDPLPIPTARLRPEGRIMELGAQELAMSVEEAQALVAAAGVEASANQIEELLHRTEGWPVGLYLAALAKQSGMAIGEDVFGGEDRWIRDYLRSELLSGIRSDHVNFLMRTSVLDELCGPLSDAVADLTGGARILEDLADHNLLVLPLDRHREWYRYHQLLRDHLHAELRLEEPNEIPELHSRAAAWYEANGMPERAIEHAQVAEDADRVAELVLELMGPVWASGRVDTVLRWMQWLEGHPSAPHYSAIMAHGALIYALLGRAADAERWAEVAERQPVPGVLPDGSSVAGTLAYLQANLAREGMPNMRRDARAAWEGLCPGSPFRPTMAYVEGVSHLLEGDVETADAHLSHACDLAAASGSMPLVSLILAERCVVAAELNDWSAADSFAQRALRTVEDGGYDVYWTSALVFATAARCAAHGGDMPRARSLGRRAARLRPLLTYALPVVSVQALVELARAYLGFAEQSGAAAVLKQAAGILQQRPDLGTLPKTVELLQARVGEIRRTARGASSLTAAELRIVPLLPTHLSMPEIGERLHISRHTVKSEVVSMYRKLGVSSRSEAVARIEELGLQA
jgi:LuxR family maltose regulon positive regulatory protein